MSSIPPLKRHRIGSHGISAAGGAGGAGGTASATKSSAAGDSEDEDDLGAVLPSDTHAALIFLLRQFPAVEGLSRFPLVLQHTIYTVIHDRGKVDRELDHLLRDGKIRRFDSATGPGQAFVALSHDYNREVSRWCALQDGSLLSDSQSTESTGDAAVSAGKSSSRSPAGPSGNTSVLHEDNGSASCCEAAQSLHARFCRLQRERSMSITRLELERKLNEGSNVGGKRAIDGFLRQLVQKAS